jgi:Flp pilus assembly protein TadG
MHSTQRRKTYAQSVVEFALVGPLFFLMLIGTVEMGRAVYVNHQIANATREGARWAAVHGSKSSPQATSAGVKTQMMTKVSGVNSGSLTVVLSLPNGNNDPGSKARVASTYTFTPIVSMVFGGAATLTFSHTSEVIIKH